MTVGSLKNLFADAFKKFGEDQVPRLAAALTFYAMMALAPMLLFAVASIGLILGNDRVREGLIAEVSRAMGEAQATLVESIIATTQATGDGILATLFGLVVLIFGASAMFEQLRLSVNAIWGVKAPEGGLKQIVLRKTAAVVMVFLGAIILLGWMILDARLSYLRRYELDTPLPLWQILSFVVALAFLTGVFAVAFKYLPRKKLEWGDVWLAAGVTSLLFALGKFGLSLYFAHSSVGSAYGAAGAVVLLLLWVYYSAQIFFFGVELSDAYAHRFGSLQNEEHDEECTITEAGGLPLESDESHQEVESAQPASGPGFGGLTASLAGLARTFGRLGAGFGKIPKAVKGEPLEDPEERRALPERDAA